MSTRDRNQQLEFLGWWLHAAGLAVLLAGGVLFHTAVWRPLGQQQQASAERLERLERFLDAAANTRHEHAQLQHQLSEVQRRAEAVRQRIPDQPQEADFLRQVSQAADEEGLQIRDYRRGKVTEREGYWQLDVRLLCEGNYRSICGFLDRLDQLPRASMIEKMQLAVEGQAEVYPLDLTLVLYFGVKSRPPDDRNPLDG